MFQHIKRMNEHSASLLLLLLCADSAFIVLHIISKTLVLNCPLIVLLADICVIRENHAAWAA